MSKLSLSQKPRKHLLYTPCDNVCTIPEPNVEWGKFHAFFFFHLLLCVRKFLFLLVPPWFFLLIFFSLLIIIFCYFFCVIARFKSHLAWLCRNTHSLLHFHSQTYSSARLNTIFFFSPPSHLVWWYKLCTCNSIMRKFPCYFHCTLGALYDMCALGARFSVFQLHFNFEITTEKRAI